MKHQTVERLNVTVRHGRSNMLSAEPVLWLCPERKKYYVSKVLMRLM